MRFPWPFQKNCSSPSESNVQQETPSEPSDNVSCYSGRDLIEQTAGSPVWVTFCCSYLQQNLPHEIHIRYLDYAPNFPMSQTWLNMAAEIPGAQVEIFHTEPPKPYKVPTHFLMQQRVS